MSDKAQVAVGCVAIALTLLAVWGGGWSLLKPEPAKAQAPMTPLGFALQQNALATKALACLMAEGLKNDKAHAAMGCATFFDPPPHNAGESQ